MPDSLKQWANQELERLEGEGLTDVLVQIIEQIYQQGQLDYMHTCTEIVTKLGG